MKTLSRPRLGVNIDHVATVRKARGEDYPDPVRAALLALEAGADSITAHLREDRRHICDADIENLKSHISAPLNLEMAPTDEMLRFVLQQKPDACCIVPERREEVTTEGGLNVVGLHNHLVPFVKELRSIPTIRISFFVEPQTEQLEAAAASGVDVVELHTGRYCRLHLAGDKDGSEEEWSHLVEAAAVASKLGLEVHAGHGLDFETAQRVSAIEEIAELNIGHFIVSEALFTGMPDVVKRMMAAMESGRNQSASNSYNGSLSQEA